MKEKFFKQYNKVFNKDGSMKLCGREECKKLMLICGRIKPNVDFGVINAGFLNTAAIKELAQELKGE